MRAGSCCQRLRHVIAPRTIINFLLPWPLAVWLWQSGWTLRDGCPQHPIEVHELHVESQKTWNDHSSDQANLILNGRLQCRRAEDLGCAPVATRWRVNVYRQTTFHNADRNGSRELRQQPSNCHMYKCPNASAQICRQCRRQHRAIHALRQLQPDALRQLQPVDDNFIGLILPHCKLCKLRTCGNKVRFARSFEH